MEKVLYLFIVVVLCFAISGCTKKTQQKQQETQIPLMQQDLLIDEEITMPEAEDALPQTDNQQQDNLKDKLKQLETRANNLEKSINTIDDLDSEVESDADIKDIDDIEEEFEDDDED